MLSYEKTIEPSTNSRRLERKIMDVKALNEYIEELFKFWDGENDDFKPLPIPEEIDREMQRDSFY